MIPRSTRALASGNWGLDRAALLVKLRQAGVTPKLFSETAEKYSLGRLYGLIDRLRHLSPADEQDLFEYRYLVVQPNLDQSAFKLWGQLPSSTGREARGRWLGEQTSRTGGGLITLCWYHHHIAIHQMGFKIDPASHTHRRRLIGLKTTTGPPAQDRLQIPNARLVELPSRDFLGVER